MHIGVLKAASLILGTTGVFIVSGTLYNFYFRKDWTQILYELVGDEERNMDVERLKVLVKHKLGSGGLSGEFIEKLLIYSKIEDIDRAQLEENLRGKGLSLTKDEKERLKKLADLNIRYYANMYIPESAIFAAFGLFSLIAYQTQALEAYKAGQYTKIGATALSSWLVGIIGDVLFKKMSKSHECDIAVFGKYPDIYRSSPCAHLVTTFATAATVSVATGYAVASLL
jgi:hypothetical protein